jgi:drug/metabolite transporter (DMT)-like permease
MSKTAIDTYVAPVARPALVAGLAIAIGGAVLFSTKAVVAKLLYRYHIDAVTLIAFRMLFSLPVFAGVAIWKMRTQPPLSYATAGAWWGWAWSATTCPATSISSACNTSRSGWSA